MRRADAAGPLPRETYELAGPDRLTGTEAAAVWSEVLGRAIRYGGDDLEALETRMKAFAPAWLAYDMRQMMRRYQEDGAVSSREELARLTALLGHPPRSYRAFAEEAAAAFTR